MNRYQEGLQIIEEVCGQGKDKIIALSTIALETGSDNQPRPFVRDVDAYYEDGVFYVTTWAESLKMLQIAQNPAVAFSVSTESISGIGIGENLGWVLAPENRELRAKLRQVFADWYDIANNEESEQCVILAIRITHATVVKDHGAVRYELDLEHKTESVDARIQ